MLLVSLLNTVFMPLYSGVRPPGRLCSRLFLLLHIVRSGASCLLPPGLHFLHYTIELVNAPKPPQFFRLQAAHVPPLLHIGATFLGEPTFRLEYQHEMWSIHRRSRSPCSLKGAWRAGTRRDGPPPRSRPLPGPPLINSTSGVLLIKVRRRRIETFPHPFGPHLRTQLTASPNHFGSRTR